MEDMKFKELKWKYLDYQGKVTVIIVTNAPNKVLDETLSRMGQWNRDVFQGNIRKAGYHLEYVELNNY